MALIKKKKFGRWILLFAGILIVSLAFVGNINVLRVRRETRGLELQIQKLSLLADSLSDEIVKLRSDTAYIEKIAREKLGMARQDEILYKFAGDAK
jgi:cell division protein FtsB